MWVALPVVGKGQQEMNSNAKKQSNLENPIEILFFLLDFAHFCDTIVFSRTKLCTQNVGNFLRRPSFHSKKIYLKFLRTFIYNLIIYLPLTQLPYLPWNEKVFKGYVHEFLKIHRSFGWFSGCFIRRFHVKWQCMYVHCT